MTAIFAAIVTLTAVLGFTLLRGETYASYTRIMATPAPSPAGDRTSSLDAWRTAQIQVQSFPGLITSGDVLSPVIQELNLSTSPGRLARQIDAEVPVEAIYMNITVTSDSPNSSAAIARSLVAHFVERYNTLNRQALTPLRVYAVNQPQVPSSPASPDKRLAFFAANTLAVAAAVLTAILRMRLARHVEDEHDVALIAGPVPILPVTDDDRVGPYRVVVARLQAQTHELQEQKPGGIRIAVIPSGPEDALAEAHNLAAAYGDMGQSALVISAAGTALSSTTGGRALAPSIGAAAPARQDPTSMTQEDGPTILACSPPRENFNSDAHLAGADIVVIQATLGRTRKSALRNAAQLLATLDIPLFAVVLHDGREAR